MPQSPRTPVRGPLCFRTPEGVTTTHPEHHQNRERLLTTAEAAHLATQWRAFYSDGQARVTQAAIRQWRHRGHLTPRALDTRGRALYHREDLSRAERATRDIALNPRLAVARTP